MFALGDQAGLSLLLHASKNSFSSAMGVLFSKKGDSSTAIFALPLAHTQVLLSFAQMAVQAILQHAATENLEALCVYYFPSRNRFSSQSHGSEACRVIAEALGARILVIPNQVFEEKKAAMGCEVSTLDNGKWSCKTCLIQLEAGVWEALAGCLSKQQEQSVIDLEDHLEDPSKIWITS